MTAQISNLVPFESLFSESTEQFLKPFEEIVKSIISKIAKIEGKTIEILDTDELESSGYGLRAYPNGNIKNLELKWIEI
ncbi:MAG: hypothetical protein ACTSRI_05080 [Promethearchaeota archaeon]